MLTSASENHSSQTAPLAALTTPLSTPKKRSKHPDATRDEHIRIQSLAKMAHWTPRSNAKKLSLAPNQVYYALHHQLTLQKHRSGRKSGIDTPRRSGLVQYVISDARTRRLRYIDVASELEWDVLESVMPRPLAKEGKRILLNISAIYEYFSKLCPESRSEKAPYL